MPREEADPIEFAKMRVGIKQLDDAILNLGSYRKVHPQYGDKNFVLKAIYNHDYDTLRNISDYFYEASGIYYRLCRYLAFLYRYDWVVTPMTVDMKDESNTNKELKDFANVLNYLDKSEVKRTCGDIALEVMKSGVYYGLIIDNGDYFALQKLPAAYCRSRFNSGLDPIVELNLQFFDAYFPNPAYKVQVLKMFPPDIQKAYVLWKQGKLKGDYPGDKTCWVVLEPGTAVKVSMNDNDFPPLVGVIPSIIDLDQAQELDRKKTMQQLLKIVVQKFPLDKNNEPVFDIDEMQDLHNNVVKMLRRAIGVDVLSTPADISVEDMADKNSRTTVDDLEKVERTVYNNSGIAQNLFNADGNIAVQNSILNDESDMRDLVLRLQSMYSRIISKFNRKGHYSFMFNILETTQYNYKELSKMYKEQEQYGHSKMLSQIALGHSQSMILATIQFENDVLHLAESMVPPMSSNNISKNTNIIGGDKIDTQKAKNGGQQQETKSAGRPEKEDSEKSDKTIANRQSMS